MTTGCAVPVAFFVFNRPETTRRVFAAIRVARPPVLLIVADGARAGRVGEAERVAEVRAIATAVDWPCDVRTNFADTNMGCKKRVSSGLYWVFDEVEQAIILEDDCLPSPAFFTFSSEMLNRYVSDRRVYCISGSNFSGNDIADGHYYSNFALMWGWASWRDRWADYEFEPAMPSKLLIKMWWRQPLAYLVWRNIFAELVKGRLNAWDFQWMLTLWKHNALTVRPTVNLVQNIGFGALATNTSDGNAAVARMTAWNGDTQRLSRAPASVRADRRWDAVDSRVWLVASLRSVIRMYLPWLAAIARKLR